MSGSHIIEKVVEIIAQTLSAAQPSGEAISPGVKEVLRSLIAGLAVMVVATGIVTTLLVYLL